MEESHPRSTSNDPLYLASATPAAAAVPIAAHIHAAAAVAAAVLRVPRAILGSIGSVGKS